MINSQNKVNLREIALHLFKGVFQTIDAEIAVYNSVRIEKSTLYICNESFELSDFPEIYAIALGKAAMSMAFGLNQLLSEKITAGIASAPKSENKLPAKWQVFAGGHPIPNQESLAAAQASIELLKKANHPNALVIYLISGGGSAMLELPKDESISLKDLQKTNQILVNCGASINEINKLRRIISKIKGGGLSRIAPFARQVSLIISDTNKGDLASVASGPTIQLFNSDNSRWKAIEIVEKYQIKDLLPKTIFNFFDEVETHNFQTSEDYIKHSIYSLLDNSNAVESLEESAKKLGFITEIVDDLVETEIAEGCRELIKRLLSLKEKNSGKDVAIISGGEFVCPVRGNGVGGRNLETTLRCLLEIEKQTVEKFDFAILSGGTDGIDGNSPVAGAIADQTSLKRAKNLGLNPNRFLENSDSYNFFQALGDVIETGATGTNVRDVRILLAKAV
ncbi:MAG TPA: DUF4147 domain-containing protein [Pyrinomonadaceae bacterium]|nr:DUF4147 domain-containing protein [Pyrinomonadaceae bacterium]